MPNNFVYIIFFVVLGRRESRRRESGKQQAHFYSLRQLDARFAQLARGAPR
jgi:hypothetical protein